MEGLLGGGGGDPESQWGGGGIPFCDGSAISAPRPARPHSGLWYGRKDTLETMSWLEVRGHFRYQNPPLIMGTWSMCWCAGWWQGRWGSTIVRDRFLVPALCTPPSWGALSRPGEPLPILGHLVRHTSSHWKESEAAKRP